MKRIGKYKILQKIGVGGMATVYLVEDELMHQPMALKVLHHQYTDNETIRRRFIQEAKLQMNLNHMNIIRCYNVDVYEQTYYILLEYVNGPSLSSILRESNAPLPIPVALAYFSQILAAMDYAHRMGVIHRDIKPHNVLIANYTGRVKETDVVKIGDFGIAKALGSTSHTSTGAKLGTLFYMSPEQVKSSGEVDTRSDIYSLGITLYQMVTGHLPFRDTSNEFSVMEAIVKEEIIPPSRFNPEIPDWLVQVIQKATQKNPAKRFKNCREFSQAIAEGLNSGKLSGGKSITPRPTPIPDAPTPRQSSFGKSSASRWPIIAGISGAILLLILLATAMVQFSGEKIPEHLVDGTVKEAVQELQQMGLDYRINYQFSESVPAGRVLSSKPAPGAAVEAGQEVLLWVSRGPRNPQIPNLLNLTYREGIGLLESRGLRVGQIERIPGTPEDEGKIIGTSPRGGSYAPNGSSVNLKIIWRDPGYRQEMKYFSPAARRYLKNHKVFFDSLLLADNFEDNSNHWPVTGDGQCQIRNNLLKITQPDHPLNQLYPVPLDSISQFIVRLDVRHNPDINSSGGLYLLRKEKAVAVVADYGPINIFLGKLENGRWKRQSYSFTPAANLDYDVLEIVRWGGKVTVFVNGKLVGSIADSLMGGKAALFLNNHLKSPSIAFENFAAASLL